MKWLVREARAAGLGIAITTAASELGVRALFVQNQELPSIAHRQISTCIYRNQLRNLIRPLI